MILTPSIAPHSSVITYLSPESISLEQNRISTQTPTSTAWPSANLAIYIPFTLRTAVTAYKMFTANGATASNSFDIGIYTLDGTRIVSTGTTAQSGTSALQIVDIADTTLGPGTYYLAMACNGTTGTYQRASGISIPGLSAFGILNQASAFNLPATATFAANTQTYIPIFGFSTVVTL